MKDRAPINAILILLAALLCLSARAQPQTITGKAVGVCDGDTITVLDAAKQQHKVRLDGIDAPESAQTPATARSRVLRNCP